MRECRGTYDAHNTDIDQRDEDGSDPFQLGRHSSSLDNDGDTVDDDLKQKLDFKHITEQNEEQNDRASKSMSAVCSDVE